MDDFVALAALVRPPVAHAAPPPESEPAANTVSRAPAPAIDVCGELGLLRVAAAEAFERAARALLDALGRDVLARELRLAPADAAALVARALRDLDGQTAIAIVVAPDDLERVHAPVAVRVDARLVPGDVVVEVAGGTLASTLAFRFDAALDAACGV